VKDANTLIVAVGAQFTELAVANWIPIVSSEPPLGETTRKHSMKLHPGKPK
jgi:hypothetical protein